MSRRRLATAEWADATEVERKYSFKAGTIWLGRSQHGYDIGHGDDQHVATVGRTRGGKGTTSIIPTLLTWPGSICVVDPKGENATVTANRRGPGSKHALGMGQTVHVLDPFHVAHVNESLRSRFNPLDLLDPHADETVDEAARIADALIVVRPDSKDPFWDESARELVKTLILHVVSHPKFEGRRNLMTVRRLIMRGDWEGVEDLRQAGEKDIPPPQGLLWSEVADNPSFRGVVADGGTAFFGLWSKGEKSYESVLQSAMRNTEFLDSAPMQRVLEKSDFKLSDLKTRSEGVSLYLSLPQRYMATHYRWLRMMIALTLTEMEKTIRPAVSAEWLKSLEVAGKRTPLNTPLLMVLDEFAGLKRMEAIENSIAQIAGYGVKMFLVLQSLEQLKSVYKDNWETFIANCGTKVFFNVEDHFSREYVSKLIGETELVRETGSRNEAFGDTNSASQGRSSSASSTTSRNRGTSYSKGHTRSESVNQSTGRSDSESESGSRSRSRSGGTNSSESFSTSQGQNSSTSDNWGRSGTATFGPGFFGFSSRPSSVSDSESYGRSTSHGMSSGSSQSRSQGRSNGWSFSDTEGTQTGRSFSRNSGSSEGSSDSENHGTSDGYGESDSRSFSENENTTRGRSYTATSGSQETLHRRPLIHPDEVGRVFASIGDRQMNGYPGLALVLISGQWPVVVRRTNYYEDETFAGLFDPHPDHPEAPVPTLDERIAAALAGHTFGQSARRPINAHYDFTQGFTSEPYRPSWGERVQSLWERTRAWIRDIPSLILDIPFRIGDKTFGEPIPLPVDEKLKKMAAEFAKRRGR